jgi:hypothetical protein
LRNSVDKSSGEIPELLKKSATADSFSLPQNPGECVISAIFTHVGMSAYCGLAGADLKPTASNNEKGLGS